MKLFSGMFLFAAVLAHSGATAQRLRIRSGLKSGVYLTGEVVDDLTGKPICGSRVSLSRVSHVLNQTGPFSTIAPIVFTTRCDGRFYYRDLAVDEFKVEATKAGYQSLPYHSADDAGGDYHLTAPGKRVRLRLAPSAVLTGTIRDHTGHPLGTGAAVILRRERYRQGWSEPDDAGEALTFDANGDFRFEDLRPGVYRLVADIEEGHNQPLRYEDGRPVRELPVAYPTANAEGLRPGFILHEGQHLHINLQLRQGALHHVLYSAQPEPAYSGEFIDSFGFEHDTRSLSGSAETAEAWLPNGLYTLWNGRPGEISGPMPFAVKDEDITNLHFRIEPTAKAGLSTQIAVSDSLPPDSTCQPFGERCGGVYLELIYVQPSGQGSVGEGVFASFNGAETMSNHPTTVLPGRITFNVSSWGAQNMYAKSIKSGSFDLASGPLLVQPGNAPAPIEILLGKGASIEGRVSRQGHPARAWVYALPIEDGTKEDFRTFSPVFTGKDGSFVLKGFAPGSYLVFASKIEIDFDLHDLRQRAYWSSRGRVVQLAAGEPMHLDLTAVFPTNLP